MHSQPARTVRAFAHRGGAHENPENTLKAFSHAAALGYRDIETDVQASADGTLFVFHDEDTARLTGQPGRIAERTAAEIAGLRVAGETVPRLGDVLAAFPDMRFNIDPKNDGAVAPLIALLRGEDPSRFCFGSFSGRRLRALRDAVPGIATATTPGEVAKLAAAALAGGRIETAAVAAQVPPAAGGVPVVTRRFVAAAHRSNLEVHVWTIDNPDEMARLIALGVDGLMTDRPSLLKSVLQARKCWPGGG